MRVAVWISALLSCFALLVLLVYPWVITLGHAPRYLLQSASNGQAELETASNFTTLTAYQQSLVASLKSPPQAISFDDEAEQKLLVLINEKRASLQASAHSDNDPKPLPLLERPALNSAARAHALDMLQRGFQSSINPDGRDFPERIGIFDRRLIYVIADEVSLPIDLVKVESGAQLAQLIYEVLSGAQQSTNPENSELSGALGTLLSEAYDVTGVGIVREAKTVRVVQILAASRAELVSELPINTARGQRLNLQLTNNEVIEYALADNTGQRFVFGPVTPDVVPDVGMGEYRLILWLDSDGLSNQRLGPYLVFP